MRARRPTTMTSRKPDMTALLATPALPPAPGPAPHDDIAATVRLRPRESGALRRALDEAVRDGLARALLPSPVGPMLAVADDAGLRSLWFLDADHGLDLGDVPRGAPGHAHVAQLARELAEYFAGTRRRFDVPVAPRGTPFQEAVWRRLLAIECGDTVSYGAIARELGKPGASRAVGLAVGRNPVSILVPCHRVIGENGTLTGYAGGLPRKRFLLALERGGDLLGPAAPPCPDTASAADPARP